MIDSAEEYRTIIVEALATYEKWVESDDNDPASILTDIVFRMREKFEGIQVRPAAKEK